MKRSTFLKTLVAIATIVAPSLAAGSPGAPAGIDPFSLAIWETGDNTASGLPTEHNIVQLPEFVSPGDVGIYDSNGALSDVLRFGNNSTNGTLEWWSRGAAGFPADPHFGPTKNAAGVAFYQAGGPTCGVDANCYTFHDRLDNLLVRYGSNLTVGDSVVNITNTGQNGNSLFGPGFGDPAGNLCVNVYAFSPDEQLISCCSCLVTPNGLVHLTANNDLVSNTLTGIRPDSIVIKLVATGAGANFKGSSCSNSAALAGTEAFPVAGGALAWGTTLHSASNNDPPSGPFSVTETPFLPATLGAGELASIRNRCTNIIGNGSTFGQCRSCRLGGLGGAKL